MPSDPESRRSRAKQVGMLMQSYRRAYEADGKKGRLSQEGLLKLMGEVDPVYLERYNHSTVARWESGATRPTRDRLEAFGKALNLSDVEVQGMVWLAGLNGDEEYPQFQNQVDRPALDIPNQEAGPGQSADESWNSGNSGVSYAGQASRFVLTKFAIPGVAVAATGYVLTLLGWNAGWVMTLYVILAIFLVMFQGFLRLRRSHELRELYFITVFFLLSGSLLQAPAIRMDPYGFYALADFANSPIPYLLASLANMVLALIAGLMFDVLWRWQYTSGHGFDNSCHRAAWTTFPPLLFVYVCALIFCCMGMWVFLLLVFSVMGAVFMAVLVMRDDRIEFRNWEKKLLLQVAFGGLLVLTAVGGAAIIILYLEPSPLAIPDHNILRSWVIDFEALGYSPDELLERYRIAAVLSSMSTLIYMLLVLGGILLATIYRLNVPEESESMAPSPAVGAFQGENDERSPGSAAAGAGALDSRAWLETGTKPVQEIVPSRRDGG